jgi:hypothetical protein
MDIRNGLNGINRGYITGLAVVSWLSVIGLKETRP